MIERLVTPVLDENCYLVSCDKTAKAILVDPGSGSRMISGWLKERNKDIQYIVLTHGHWDHIGAVEELRKELGVIVAVHREDAEMLTNAHRNFSAFVGQDTNITAAEILLEDNQILHVGEMTVKVIHTPGHTPGGICLLTKDGLISGDTLFDGAVGRTDFPGGSMKKLIKGIKEKLLVLDDSLKVFPGHGSSTTIGREKKINPYLKSDFAE